MRFPVFLLLLWGMGLYYRAMHRAYIAELAALAPLLKTAGANALAGKDWLPVRRDGDAFILKRAFEVRKKDGTWDRQALKRYAPPFVFFAVILWVLQDWQCAFGYAALVALGWFFTQTVLKTGDEARYDVLLFGMRLFGEKF